MKKMAFKTFNFGLWMFLVFFTVVKGSCLEYGHSCWGAHGKRSGSNKIYSTEIKTPTDIDYQDLNGLSEKNIYASPEEQLNTGFTDAQSSQSYDEFVETPHKATIKLNKLLYKKLNKPNGKQRNLELDENQMRKSNIMPMNNKRRRFLPFYNLRHVEMTRPDNAWLKQLDPEQPINEDNYI